ncbi:MAG: NADH-quinone oxidoreductase subunit B family protein [Candidatus Thermoplasmatota archaeon]
MKLSKTFDKALWVFHINSGSCNACDIEIVAAITPRYDTERFGIKLVGSPRHADVLLFTGPVTRKMKDRVIRVYEQTPDPKVVLICGNCGTSTGVYYDGYAIEGPLDELLPDDANILYVNGCPVRPESIINGVKEAWLYLEKVRGDNK